MIEVHEFILRLLVAHLLADFLIQPKRMVNAKLIRSWRSSALYLHVAIHIACSFLLLWTFDPWVWILLLGVSHLLIDLLKIHLSNRYPHNETTWFILDQALHIGMIFLISYLYNPAQFELANAFPDISATFNWGVILGALALTTPAAFLVKALMQKFPLPSSESTHGLENAGLYIGVLERLLTFTFILTGHWEAVGFLIAAKSIFRFGDLREQKDIRLTEYILIGTFLSFGLAIMCALLVQYFA